MKQCYSIMTAVLLFGFLFAGCEADESINPIEADTSTETTTEFFSTNKSQEGGLPSYFVEKLKSTVINTYTVDFLGRTVLGTGENTTTTFRYKVSGGGATPQLDSFTLGIPGCSGGLLTWSPQQASNLYADAIKWNKSVAKDGSEEYLLTFRGDLPLGLISSTVTRGSLSETKDILGPCNGVYTLSGSIFIDANSDGVKQTSESGIPSFLIDLYTANGEKITTVPTSANGSYSFMVLKGDYRIEVNENPLDVNNYTPVGNASFSIQDVRENRSGFNFGYSVNSSKIIQNLEEKVIVVNTQPTKFWVQQIRNAGKKGSMYTKEEIRGFLISIEGLLLAEPFNFGTEKEATAVSILSNPIRSEFDAFLQQLLTAELNIVSGRGALLDPETNTLDSSFNSALLIYSEAVACVEMGSCPVETGDISGRAAEVKAVSSNDTRMLASFNGSGGV